MKCHNLLFQSRRKGAPSRPLFGDKGEGSNETSGKLIDTKPHFKKSK
jgi:hypothetical protein